MSKRQYENDKIYHVQIELNGHHMNLMQKRKEELDFTYNNAYVCNVVINDINHRYAHTSKLHDALTTVEQQKLELQKLESTIKDQESENETLRTQTKHLSEHLSSIPQQIEKDCKYILKVIDSDLSPDNVLRLPWDFAKKFANNYKEMQEHKTKLLSYEEQITKPSLGFALTLLWRVLFPKKG